MNGNYEWNRQLTQQRLQARYRDAAAQRQVRAGRTADQRPNLRWLNPLTWLAALWRRRPQRQARPVASTQEVAP